MASLSFIASRIGGIETIRFSSGHIGKIWPHRHVEFADEGFVSFSLNGTNLGDAFRRELAFGQMVEMVEAVAT